MIATYRLQLTPDFDFSRARATLVYLRQLGISHICLSPITEAQPGSKDGYDPVDHNAVCLQLGGPLQLQLLLAEARKNRLQTILEIVPGHAGMANNAWFQEVLTYGPHAPHARYFDIAWRSSKPELDGKIFLPLPGIGYGEALASGALDLVFEQGRLYAACGAARYALKPETYAHVLTKLAEHACPGVEAQTLLGLAAAFKNWHEPDVARGEALIASLQGNLDTAQFDAMWQALPPAELHTLLETQYWHLASSRLSSDAINYRRYLDNDRCIALRAEDPQVFAATHRLVKEMLCDDGVAGLMIFHTDGLRDPYGYLERLRTLGARHLWIDKLLGRHEHVPPQWPVDGTSGDASGADIAALLTHPHGRAALTSAYRSHIKSPASMRQCVRRSKRLVMKTGLAADLHRLACDLECLMQASLRTRDVSQTLWRAALVEVVACFVWTRTYLPQGRHTARRVVQQAMRLARRHNRLIDAAAIASIGEVVLGAIPGAPPALLAWVGRFEQFSASVHAKGVLDVAYARQSCFLAHNERGHDWQRFSLSTGAFHRRAIERGRKHPLTLLATSGSGSKRGEDLRMRLAVLSELAPAWQQTVRNLYHACEKHRGAAGPTRQHMHFFFQILVAAWDVRDATLPVRLAQTMQNVARDGQTKTSWQQQNLAYEAALDAFVAAAMQDEKVHALVAGLAPQLAHWGLHNSLTQAVLKCTTPGVADFYQGCELLDLSLGASDRPLRVDDARRDGCARRLAPLLAHPQQALLGKLLKEDGDAAKLYTIARLLRLRQQDAEFLRHAHTPLHATGQRRGHLLCYARGPYVVVAPRFFASLAAQGGWGDTCVPLPEGFAGRKMVEYLSGTELTMPDALVPSAWGWPWGVFVPLS